MGLYNHEGGSPKKGRGRSSFLDMKRKFSRKRHLCLCIMFALVPCYLLRQMFYYPSSSPSSARDAIEVQSAVSSEQKVPYGKPSEIAELHAKAQAVVDSGLDFLYKHTGFKPAQYKKILSPLTGKVEDVHKNSLKLRLKPNFEDEEDFGSAEDNDKVDEQNWTANHGEIRRGH